MAFWNRTPAPAATRAWVTITTRGSGPALALREASRAARLSTVETINFDDHTAATSPRLRSVESVLGAGEPMPLTPRERFRLAALLRELRATADVTDIIFETHVAGKEDVHSSQSHPVDELIEFVERDQLRAG
ncbi:MAG: hypothetical protein JWN41_1455, partial [Thermoleophilia bacterium]|nr:hypothetical protein [Thermoleophilia bacterium]